MQYEPATARSNEVILASNDIMINV